MAVQKLEKLPSNFPFRNKERNSSSWTGK